MGTKMEQRGANCKQSHLQQAVIWPRIRLVMDATSEKEPFDYAKWEPQLPELARAYQQAQPFPSIRMGNFLAEEVARTLEREFPKPNDMAWIQYKHYNENKL